jgi:ribosomal protein S18 acetylase RimI-like enzyme
MGNARRQGRLGDRLTIRDMRTTDRPLLARWDRDLALHIAREAPRYLSTNLPARYGKVDVADWLRKLRKKGGFVILAQRDHRPVGYISVDLPEDPKRLQLWEGRPTLIAHVQSVYVEPKARGKGIGEALFREVERRLRRFGFDALYLHAATTNQRAVRFYRRLGLETDQVRFRKVFAPPPKSWALVAVRRARARQALRRSMRGLGRKERTGPMG